ncbi:hypothetical protein ES703_62849 [subsurface metagenome]
MDGRGHDVGRLFTGHLQDELGQVRLYNLDTRLLQNAVEPDLFGSHGLGFHHQPRLPLLADPFDIVAGVSAIAGQIEVAATGGYRCFQPRQQLWQAVNGRFLDGPGTVFQPFVVLDIGGGFVAPLVEGLGVAPYRLALNVQGHSYRPDQGTLHALVRHFPGVYRALSIHLVESGHHLFFQDDNVQVIGAVYPLHQLTHIGGHTGPGDKDKAALQALVLQLSGGENITGAGNDVPGLQDGDMAAGKQANRASQIPGHSHTDGTGAGDSGKCVGNAHADRT